MGRLSATVLILSVFAGCGTLSPSPNRDNRAYRPPDTQLILLNVAEGSGWVAFHEGGGTEDSELYRIRVTRASTGAVIYESTVYLPVHLQTHGFEMAHDDPRLARVAQQVDSEILAPLRQGAQQTTPAPTAPPALTALDVEVLELLEDGMRLSQPPQQPLAVGQTLYLRTPPEFLTDPVDGQTVMISRGRVAALLEVTEASETEMVILRRSGEIPEAGFFELAD